MMREYQVRISEGLGVKFPGPTRQSRHFALRKTAPLFDHLVSERKQPVRDVETERLGGLAVDDHLEFRRLRDREVGRFLALEDAAHIDAGLFPRAHNVGSVA